MGNDDDRVVYGVRDGQVAIIADDDRVIVIEPEHRAGQPMDCVEALVMACAHRHRDDETFADEMLRWFAERMREQTKH